MADALQFDRVSKRYVLGDRLNARESLYAAAARLVGGPRRPSSEIWSLREVSFTLGTGETLGIVGRNGAGKSTILKVLAGITTPTSGSSRTRGRVAALLEVGTGFHPELTGRENVYLNGAILGMSRRDITRRFDEIVAFSGVERFLDTPVKRYSSGMHLRLAFAVAAHLDPDVLVVDEILAVGDAEFQRKCLGRMQEAGREGRTLVFVSHDLETLSSLCDRSVWLEAGRVRDDGPSLGIVRDYLEAGLSGEGGGGTSLRAGPVTVEAVRVVPDEPGRTALLRGESIRVQVELEVEQDVPGLDLAVFVTSAAGARVLDEVLSDRSPGLLPRGSHRVEMLVPPVLNVGDYTVGVWLGTHHEEILDAPAVTSFAVLGADLGRPQRLVVLDLPFEVHRR